MATMEVASASFQFCLLGSKVFIFRYFHYHFAFVELVVCFDERFTTFFICFCSIFAFPTHFVFTPVTFLLDYSWLWLTSWVSFVVVATGIATGGELKKKMSLKKDWESPPQLFLENYGKP